MGYKYKDKAILQLTATTDEQYVDFDVIKLSSINNFGTNGLLISFDIPFDDADNMYLRIPGNASGKYSDDEEIGCKRIYYKSISGTTDFQIVGFKSWGALPNSFA